MSETKSAPAGDFEPILRFWFGVLDADGRADPAHARRWFNRDEGFDREIVERYGASYAEVAARRREIWLDTPRGRLAYVIALDQFPRNMFRGTARAFESDAQALAAAVDGITRGDDRALALDERWFLYMPLMHSEKLAMQDRALALFTELAASAPPALRADLGVSVDYARRHRDIIARFGRFPHRNATLERESTPEEMELLKEPGTGF